MIDHICPEPGCGMLEERVLVERLTTSHDEHYIYECPRNADAHALCARVAELEALCRTIKTAWVEQDLVGFQEALDKVEAPHEP